MYLLFRLIIIVSFVSLFSPSVDPPLWTAARVTVGLHIFLEFLFCLDLFKKFLPFVEIVSTQQFLVGCVLAILGNSWCVPFLCRVRFLLFCICIFLKGSCISMFFIFYFYLDVYIYILFLRAVFYIFIYIFS